MPILILGIYSLIVLAMVVLVVKWPGTALAALLCNFPMAQWSQATHPFFVQYLQLTNYVTMGIVCLALLVKLTRRELTLAGTPRVAWLTLVLFVYAAFSILWSFDVSRVLGVWQAQAPKLVYSLVLGSLLVTRTDDVRHGVRATIAFGLLILVLLFTTANWGVRGVYFVTGARVAGGIETNPLAIGFLAAQVIMLILLYNFRGAGPVREVVRWSVVAFSLVVIHRTGSRGALLGSVACTLMFMPLSRRIKNLRGFLGTSFGTLMVGVIVYFVFQQMGEGRFAPDKMVESFQAGRLRGATLLLGEWVTSPSRWVIGLGNSAAFSARIEGFYVHLVPAEILAEEGLIGFALMVAILVMTGRSLLRLFRDCIALREERGLVACLGALFVFEIFLWFSQGSLIGWPYAFTFAILIARYEYALRQQWAAQQESAPAAVYLDGYAVDEQGYADAGEAYSPGPGISRPEIYIPEYTDEPGDGRHYV